MKSLIVGVSAVMFASLVACSGGVRNFDLQNKQFEATYSLDSTSGIDTSRRQDYLDAKMIYSFSEGGKGTQFVKTGMLSQDSSFTWKVEKDSLAINNKRYAVEKQVKGYKLKSDSEVLILNEQP